MQGSRLGSGGVLPEMPENNQPQRACALMDLRCGRGYAEDHATGSQRNRLSGCSLSMFNMTEISISGLVVTLFSAASWSLIVSNDRGWSKTLSCMQIWILRQFKGPAARSVSILGRELKPDYHAPPADDKLLMDQTGLWLASVWLAMR